MLTRRLYRWATLLYALLIVYGSLVPFTFQPLDVEEWLNRFFLICTTPEPLRSRSDAAANVLLFIPLAFLVMGALLECRGRRGWLAVPPVVLLCTAFGASVEALQLVFPPRDCSRNDILAQALGSALGATFWVLWGGWLAKLSDRLLSRIAGRYAPYLLAYLVFLVLIETAPYDFTLSLVELVHKWREGRIGTVPFAAFLDPSRRMVTKTLTNLVLFLPLGLLLGAAGRRGTTAVLLGFLTAAGVELLQALVLTRYFEPTDIITGAIAVWLGWRILTWHLHLTPDGRMSRWLHRGLLAAWMLIAIVLYWQPFHFSTASLTDRWHAVSLVPFLDYEEKPYLIAFDEIGHVILLFALLGAMLATFPERPAPAWLCLLLGAAVAGMLEAGQLLIPERYASTSEVVLGAAGCALGSFLAMRLQDGQGPTRTTGVQHIMYG